MPAGADNFLSYTAQTTTPTIGMEPNATIGDFGLGPLGNMVAGGLTSAFVAQTGLYPGQFFPSHNVHDLLKADNYRRQQQAVATQAMRDTDVSTWLDTTEGMSRMLGVPFGLRQRGAYRESYSQMAPILSTMAQMAPELVDSLHGSRGSAAVMSQNLLRGGQYRLGADGELGLREADVKDLVSTIGGQLYSSPQQIAAMKGIGMGQLGGIFDEGARRGLLPGSLGARSRGTQTKLLATEEGKTIEELEALGEQEFGEKLRRFDSKRITSRLKDLAGSVSAMRELFGASGQPNAPMNQIINALEAITQNRLASMSGPQVEGLVRKVKAVAEGTGMGLDNVLHLTAQSAALGDTLGMDRALALKAGMRAAVFGPAYKNAFGSSFTAFGAEDVGTLQSREAKLGVQAEMSQQARQAGAFIRSVEGLGLGADTDAGKLSAALRSGQTTFNGRSMHHVLNQDTLLGILDKSGAGAMGLNAFRATTGDEFGNQEYIDKHNLGKLVRGFQHQELAEGIGAVASRGAVEQALIDNGTKQPEAANLAREKGGGLLQAIFDSDSPEEFSTAKGRQKIVEAELTKQFGAERARQMAPSVTLGFESRLNQMAKQQGYGDATKLIQSQHPMVLQQADFAERTFEAQAEVSGILSPLGKAGPLQRMMDLLQRGDANQGTLETLGKALGGISPAQVKQLMDTRTKFQTLATNGKKTPEDLHRINALKTQLSEQVGSIIVDSSPTIQGAVGMLQAGHTDNEIETAFGRRLHGPSVEDSRAFVRDHNRAIDLKNKADRTAAEQTELDEIEERTAKRTATGATAQAAGRHIMDDSLLQHHASLSRLTADERSDLFQQALDLDAVGQGDTRLTGRDGTSYHVASLLERRDDTAEDVQRASAREAARAKSGIPVAELRQFVKDEETIKTLSGQETLSETEQATLQEAKLRRTTTEMRLLDSGLAGDLGRKVNPEDLARLRKGDTQLTEAIADQTSDPATRNSRIERESSLLLARSNNIIQALYTDDASLKRLGTGGLERVKAAESSYSQMLRLTGGDKGLLTKALAGDKSVPKELRDKLHQLHGDLSANMQDLHASLAGESPELTPEDWLLEKENIDKFRREREAPDKDQLQNMTDRLLRSSGIDPQAVSDEDRQKLTAEMGQHSDPKRSDLMLAIDAREQLDAARADAMQQQGADFSDTEFRREHARLYDQAGTLKGQDDGPGAADVSALERDLKDFDPGREGRAAEAKKEITITGKLTMDDGRAGQLVGVGFTNLEGMA